MATAMASYGFERMQHMSDDDLEESASTRHMTAASYPSPTPASRKSRSGAAASKSQDMKMVEIKHGSYDPSAQRWPHHQDGGEGHHRRTVTASTTAPRRDYLREGHSPGERDHLLTQPTSPGRHARPHHGHFSSTSSVPSSPSSSATSTTATVTFTMTTSSSATSVSYSSSSTYSYSAPSPSMASSPATLPSSSSGSLASSPTLLVYPDSPSSSSSSLKKSKKHHHHHHHHHHHSKTKKRVTWVDESMEGTRLEEVIEVERYLTQHGSLTWWLELIWDNKPYFLLLLCIVLLFLASLAFILYKLVF